MALFTARSPLAFIADHPWAYPALETVHVLSYFAEEVTAAFVELGLRPRLSYFAARSAAFGAVGPEVPTATFYVFAPWLPAKALPSAWSAASPDEVQQARRDSMGVVLERVLGDVSEVELSLRECLKGACPARMVVRVPGGRVGHLEQTVEGAPVPGKGAVLGVRGADAPRTPAVCRPLGSRVARRSARGAVARGGTGARAPW